MAGRDITDLPFFAPEHRDLRKRASAIAIDAAGLIDHHDVDGSCRRLVKEFAKQGLLNLSVPETRHDVRSLCLIRESMAYQDGLCDFAFAMQGLGSGPIVLFGTDEQKRRWLPQVASGDALAAFAITEAEAGSDVAAVSCTAVPDGNEYFRISGEKTWISNGGIADHYVVFCRTGEAAGARGLSAFIVEGSNPGLEIAERIETIAPHPLARLRFNDCRVSVADRLGAGGEGFRIAMSTLDIFRSTVGAAAIGMARRAFDEAVAYSSSRKMFGSTLSALQLTQARLADMLVDIDSAALLVYRAAWTKDNGAERITRESAMAKLAATEAAQRVIDGAVQLHGGLGVKSGVKVEQLYRDIRALRIYEGASEVQKLVIARDILAESTPR
ncbi:MAG: acyl-CoA dehydrogenase family protein [Hyphomicrobiales bacterium]